MNGKRGAGHFINGLRRSRLFNHLMSLAMLIALAILGGPLLGSTTSGGSTKDTSSSAGGNVTTTTSGVQIPSPTPVVIPGSPSPSPTPSPSPSPSPSCTPQLVSTSGSPFPATVKVSQSSGVFGARLVGPVSTNTSLGCGYDATANATWISTNPNVLCYTPQTAVVSGKSIPVPGPGYFMVGIQGQTTIIGSSGDLRAPASVVVNVVAPSPSPTATPALFGNGSQGALVISSNTDWTATGVPGGTFFPQFTTLTVNAGVTLTVPSGLNIRCNGTATINGKIVVAPWATYAQTVAGGPGAAPLSTATQQAAVVRPGFWGGGAGAGSAGGAGGGTFGLRADTISIGTSGSIAANGGPGVTGNSGGGGGVVVLVWKTSFANQGAPGVSCAGGAGGSAPSPAICGGNGGGGGLVVLIGPNAAKPSTATPIAVNGGAAGASAPTTSNNPYDPVTSPGDAGGCVGAGGKTVVTTTTSSGSGFGKDTTPTTIKTYTPSAGGSGAIVAKATTNVAGTVPAAP